MAEGSIILNKGFTSWEWWDDNNTVKLFLFLLLSANSKNKSWRGIEIKRGQLVTSLEKLSSGANLSKQSVRTSLNKLEKTKEVNRRLTHQFTIVTLCNYEDYKGEKKTVNTPINTPTKQKPTKKKPPAINRDYRKKLLNELTSSDVPNAEHLEITLAWQSLFAENLKQLGVKSKSVEEARGTWVDSIRLLFKEDKRTIEEVREVYEFLKTAKFWRKNILSTSKLRKQFEKLLIESRNYEGQGKGTSVDELASVVKKEFEHLF